LTKLTLFIMFK